MAPFFAYDWQRRVFDFFGNKYAESVKTFVIILDDARIKGESIRDIQIHLTEGRLSVIDIHSHILDSLDGSIKTEEFSENFAICGWGGCNGYHSNASHHEMCWAMRMAFDQRENGNDEQTRRSSRRVYSCSQRC